MITDYCVGNECRMRACRGRAGALPDNVVLLHVKLLLTVSKGALSTSSVVCD